MLSQIDLGGGRVHDSELDRLVEARRRQMTRRGVRSAIVHQASDRVRVAMRVHLLPPRIERELLDQAASLDDRLAVLRHCDPALDPRCVDMYEHARVMRERVGLQLDAFVVGIDISIGLAPSGGPDWTSGCLPHSLIRDAGRAFANARRDVMTAVDAIVDSELLRQVSPSSAPSSLPELVLVEFDAESLARVQAFLALLDQIANRSQDVVDRMRLEALRHEHAGWPGRPPTGWADIEVDRRRALAALDGVRAVQAAIAEVGAADVRATEPDAAESRTASAVTDPAS